MIKDKLPTRSIKPARTEKPVAKTPSQKRADNLIIDKSGTVFGQLTAQYSNMKTIADKQKFLLDIHSIYFHILSLFTHEVMTHISSDTIFHGKPISHVKQTQEITTGSFASRAPLSVRAVVEPSGHRTAKFEGGVFQTATNGNKISMGSPRKPKDGEIILDGYWRDPEEPETAHFPIAVESHKPFQGKPECLALMRVAEEKAREKHFKGWSSCRICGQRNGSSDFELNGFKWPSGYSHYINMHNVMPSAEFAGMLVKLAKNNVSIAVRSSEPLDESSAIKPKPEKKILKVRPTLKKRLK